MPPAGDPVQPLWGWMVPWRVLSPGRLGLNCLRLQRVGRGPSRRAPRLPGVSSARGRAWGGREGPGVGSLREVGAYKGGLDLPGQCRGWGGMNSQPPTPPGPPATVLRTMTSAFPGWALGVYKVEGRRGRLGLFTGGVL